MAFGVSSNFKIQSPPVSVKYQLSSLSLGWSIQKINRPALSIWGTICYFLGITSPWAPHQIFWAESSPLCPLTIIEHNNAWGKKSGKAYLEPHTSISNIKLHSKLSPWSSRTVAGREDDSTSCLDLPDNAGDCRCRQDAILPDNQSSDLNRPEKKNQFKLHRTEGIPAGKYPMLC